jgi:hypothetical protein
VRLELLDLLHLVRRSDLQRLLLLVQLLGQLLLEELFSPAAVEVAVSHVVIEVLLGLVENALLLLGELEVAAVADLLPAWEGGYSLMTRASSSTISFFTMVAMLYSMYAPKHFTTIRTIRCLLSILNNQTIGGEGGKVFKWRRVMSKRRSIIAGESGDDDFGRWLMVVVRDWVSTVYVLFTPDFPQAVCSRPVKLRVIEVFDGRLFDQLQEESD